MLPQPRGPPRPEASSTLERQAQVPLLPSLPPRPPRAEALGVTWSPGGGEVGGSAAAILRVWRRSLWSAGRALHFPSPRPASLQLPRSSPFLAPVAVPSVEKRGAPEGGGGGVSGACSRPPTGGRGGALGRAPRDGAGRRGGGCSGCGGGAQRPWRPRLQLRRRVGPRRPGRLRVGAAAAAAAVGAMYRSGARSSVSSHRPKESGGGGPRTGRSSGSSSGPARRTSPLPPSGSSSRTPARRPRSPSGHRGRRASPSPPRGRRGSPSPPRGRRASPSPPRGRRVSPSPPRARRGSPSPPRGRRLFPPGPAGFRGSSRGESRSDFARDGRGDHPGDSGGRVIPPPDRDSLHTPAPSPGVPASRNALSPGAPGL